MGVMRRFFGLHPSDSVQTVFEDMAFKTRGLSRRGGVHDEGAFMTRGGIFAAYEARTLW